MVAPFCAFGLVLFALVATSTALGPAPVDLGTAGNFAILAKSGVSTVPHSVITGDVGVSPIAQAAMTCFSLVSNTEGTFATSAQVLGQLYAANDIAPTPVKMTIAVGDMETAYTDTAGRADYDHLEYNSGSLGGLTLSPACTSSGQTSSSPRTAH